MSEFFGIPGTVLPEKITTIGTLSGGVGSWGACRRWIDERGPEGVVVLFTNVGGASSSLNPGDDLTLTGEDNDTLRFLGEAALDLGVPAVGLTEGRDIWEVFRDRRFLGNPSLAHCSWELKTKPAREWITEYAPGVERVLIGIDITEIHRIPAITEGWKPYKVEAPLTWRPLQWKPQLIDMLGERGIKPPRMYNLGFGHANCPACVKGGHGHWARLYRTWPQRYAFAEAREEEQRVALGDVAILRDRTGGGSRPMTLREFRLRLEKEDSQPTLFDDEGGCGCFLEGAPAVDEEPQ